MTTNFANLSVEIMARSTPVHPSVFGIVVPDHQMDKVKPFQGFDSANPFSAFVPKQNDDYVFEAYLRSSVLMWINYPQNQSLWISGPTGCGKTSVVEQVAARLNWPVMKTTASQDLDINNLIGGLRLQCNELTGDTKTVFVHGPLTLAYKYGLIFLLDEYDQLDPSCANAFNAILEGGNLVIPETNEVIKQHPNFRFVATANSIGQGDFTGVYGDVKTLNVANLDRYMFITADYMPKETETKLITKYIPDTKVAEKFVDVANMIRGLFVGKNITGEIDTSVNTNSAKLPDGVLPDTRLSVTCSTRSLVAWLDRYSMMKAAKMPRALLTAFDYQIGNRASADDKKSLHLIVEAVFGSEALK